MQKRDRLVLLAGPLVAIIVATWLFQLRGTMGNRIVITDMRVRGESTGRALLSVPFHKSTPTSMYVNVVVDMNDDGAFSDEERVVRDVPVSPVKRWSNAFPITVPKTISQKPLHLVAALSAESLGNSWQGEVTEDAEFADVVARVMPYEITDRMDLGTVTDPENAMKGAGSSDEGVTATPSPDLLQRKDECAPTVAANSLLSLAGQHDRTRNLPRSTDLIDQLKRQMAWNSRNGVRAPDYAPGLEFAAKLLDLPVTVEPVSGTVASIVPRMEKALQEKAAVALRLKAIVTDASGATLPLGGHMVGVMDIVRTGDVTRLHMHDPLSPLGTDVYEVASDGTVLGYPFLDGKVLAVTAFLHRWEAGKPATTDGEEKRLGEVKAIDSRGHKIPLSEVTVASEGRCGEEYYRAIRGGSAMALDGKFIPDAHPNDCGYGTVADTPVYDCSRDGKRCVELRP